MMEFDSAAELPFVLRLALFSSPSDSHIGPLESGLAVAEGRNRFLFKPKAPLDY